MKTICDTHDEVFRALTRITKLKPLDYVSAQDIYDDISILVEESRFLVEEAKKQGKSMEERMCEYRTAIEKLGFKRSYKNDK